MEKKGNRILSIDIFRGLTILVMIFVNDLAGVKNIPWWMKHMPGDKSGMTFVDVVFPAFLFIVGMAIPFAIEKRRMLNETNFMIWKHILIRVAGLLTLGIFMVNIGQLNSAATGMSKQLWMLLMFISAILVWNSYPKAEGKMKVLFIGLRLIGIAALIYLAFIYRGGKPEVGWMQPYWWGILGLIGWAYLAACCVYFIFREQITAAAGMIGLFIALYIGDQTGALDFLQFVKEHLWIGGHIGGHAAITTSGMVVGMLLGKNSPVNSHRKKLKWIISFGVFLMTAGYLLAPLYGINKNLATPGWDLYSSSICCFIFAFLYWLVDVKGIHRWAGFVSPAGFNPLLAYILPDIFYALLGLFGITILGDLLGEGITGIIRAAAFSMIIVWITGILTKLKIKLHL